MSLNRPPFDEAIEKALLENGFAHYDDWKFGPESSWSHQDHYSLSLMKHDFGYWLIVKSHFGGENKTLNIGSSNSAQEIIAIRDMLSKLF